MSRRVLILLNWTTGQTSSGVAVKDRNLTPVNIVYDDNTLTGLTLNYDTAPSAFNNSGQPRTPIHGYTSGNIFYTGVASQFGSDFNIIIDGALTGESITKIKVWGYANFSDNERRADITYDGVTLRHDARDEGLQAPVEFDTNATAFPISVNCVSAPDSDRGHISIVELELTGIATADTDTFYGDTLNYTSSVTGTTSATLTDSQGNTLALTNVTDTSADVPALAAGLDGLIIEDGVTLTLSNGTDNASTTLNFIAPAGYEATTLTSVPFEPLETDWVFGFDSPALVGDQSLKLVSDSSITHNVDGTSTAIAGDSYTYYTIEASTGVLSEIVKTIELASDVTAPVITLSPTQTTYNLTVGDSFTPPVGTSTDGVDGVKTITPTGSVDVNTAGTYTLTYADTDTAGNIATPIVVTVNVSETADVTAPVITVSGPVSQSIAFGSAVPTFTASTDDGSAVVVGGDTVNNNLAGTYVITFNATDLAGNVATQVTRTVIVEAEVISSTLNMTLTGIPDGDYNVVIVNRTTNTTLERTVTFASNTASVVLVDVPVGTALDYYTSIGTTTGSPAGLSLSGVTV